MSLTIRQVLPPEVEQLQPLLLLAEPSENALRWSLNNLSDTAYCMTEEDQIVGAATVRWHKEPCEIVELAVSIERQGRGFGKQLVTWLIAEARRRGKHELLVGTSNASIGNIIFYQKCGFRMHSVREDYFWYHREAVSENGLLVRDMLVLRYDLAVERQAT